jgi:putative oxidoreductase
MPGHNPAPTEDHPMNDSTSTRSTDIGLLIVRIGIGLLFVVALGLPKLMAGPERWEGIGGAIGALGLPVVLPKFFGLLAALAEFLGGLLLVTGLLHRVGAALILLVMIVATATKLQKAGLALDTFGSEVGYPLTIGILMLGLLFTGPGRLAIAPTRRRP